MSKQEFMLIVNAMRSYWPREKILPTQEAISLWYQELADIDYTTATTTLRKIAATSKWSPSIAELRETAAEITHGEIPEWADGWEEVRHAMRFYGSYRPEEALQSMTPITRQAVERLGFAELCASENEGVDRANFRMIYEQIAERTKKSDQINPAVRERIAAVQGSKYTAIETPAAAEIEERHVGVPMPESAKKALDRLGL